VEAAQEDQGALALLEPHVTGLCYSILEEDREDYVDNAVEIASFISYFPEPLIDNTWAVCGPLVRHMKLRLDTDFDYLDQIAHPIINFITRDPAVFVTGHYKGIALVQWVMELGVQALQKNSTGDSEYCDTEGECKAVVTVVNALLVETPGQMQTFLPALLQHLLARLLGAASVCAQVRAVCHVPHVVCLLSRVVYRDAPCGRLTFGRKPII